MARKFLIYPVPDNKFDSCYRYNLNCFICLTILLAGLSFTNAQAFESIKPLALLEKELEHEVIALINVDVEITQFKSSQYKDANAMWSTSARKNIIADLNRMLSEPGATLPTLGKPDLGESRRLMQLISLQSMINLSILGHIQAPLPSKQSFVWSVGKQINLLQKHVDANFGLFLFARGGFTTQAGRPEYQAGYVSLVNLISGDTIWFDHNTEIPGDFRDPEKSSVSMRVLMRNFPVKTDAVWQEPNIQW